MDLSSRHRFLRQKYPNKIITQILPSYNTRSCSSLAYIFTKIARSISDVSLIRKKSKKAKNRNVLLYVAACISANLSCECLFLLVL